MFNEKWLTNNFENEQQFQAACILMISQQFPSLRDKVWHTPNEGYITRKESETDDQYEQRCQREGGKRKAMGVLAGVMDILFVHNGILYKIELKQPSGTLSPSQIKIHYVWNMDCPKIPVKVFYTIAEVYYFIKKVLELDMKIDFTPLNTK